MEKESKEEIPKKEHTDRKKHEQMDDRSTKENANSEDNNKTSNNSESTQKTDKDDKESIEDLKIQLNTLMNSLATLSAEKSKMEANFQLDKKQLRNEREECEKVIRDLKEKLKKAQNSNHSEMEHVKCKLIMERHEREKEQTEHSAIIKDLQKLLTEERRTKEQLEERLEAQLKTQFSHKTQCKILEAELEVTKNKLKQAEQAAKETPPLLISLQAEMSAMKKQHRNAIHDEQKRAAAAEQQARTLAMAHEARVAGLEARLAELSEIVGGYDRLRQQDQLAIQKLKNQLANLQDLDQKETVDSNISENPDELISRIKHLYNRLLDLDNKDTNSSYAILLLNNLDLCNKYKHSEYKEKYESLSQEFEEFKRQVSKYNIVTDISHMSLQQNDGTDTYDKSNNKTQLHLLKTHNSNLEERVRMLNNEVKTKEKELQLQFEHQQKLLQEERSRIEQIALQKENEYRSKIATLEQQLLRQRERSMTLIEEKDKEIYRLKASFHALLPNKDSSLALESRSYLSKYNEKPEPIGDVVKELLTNDITPTPPILHYTQELARKEVQVSNSRRRILELEACLREKQREILHMKDKQKEESKLLQSQITRLEACKSREGANLEYLKNVVINFLMTNDPSSKRHMLNAISTVLRFAPDELSKIKHFK